jgi:hypothetical protein
MNYLIYNNSSACQGIHICPVIFVVYFASHYFVVVMDYEEDVMYVVGKHTTQELAGVYL